MALFFDVSDEGFAVGRVDGRVKPGHDGEAPLFDKSLTNSRI